MSFLILLASITAMKFALRGEPNTTDDPHQEWARRHLCRPPEQEAPVTHTTALLALGEALERHGRGQIPSAGTGQTVSDSQGVERRS